MWDVSMADRLGTTPWDIRNNATTWDIIRLNLWFNAKQAGEKVEAQRQRARSKAAQGSSAMPRRPRRRR